MAVDTMPITRGLAFWCTYLIEPSSGLKLIGNQIAKRQTGTGPNGHISSHLSAPPRRGGLLSEQHFLFPPVHVFTDVADLKLY